jgi:uncharacterized protein YdeI (YjbR/CyaY-like superfamily)
MHPAGLHAFEKRQSSRSQIYSYEQERKAAALPPNFLKLFRSNPVACQFFQSQPPWYRRTASWWVISAKKEETKRKRLATLIEYSARKKSIPALARPDKRS